MMKFSKVLFHGKNAPIGKQYNLSRNFFSSFNDMKHLDMESKNTHLKIDLANPFSDEENDAKPTEWRRYWNINDSPDVQHSVFKKIKLA